MPAGSCQLNYFCKHCEEKVTRSKQNGVALFVCKCCADKISNMCITDCEHDDCAYYKALNLKQYKSTEDVEPGCCAKGSLLAYERATQVMTYAVVIDKGGKIVKDDEPQIVETDENSYDEYYWCVGCQCELR